MSELERKSCLTPTWHGPHPWWWTDSDGGHMLDFAPTEIDHEINEGLTQYACPGKPEEAEPQHHEEPLSEQTFEAFETGVKNGRKQAIKQIYERLYKEHPDAVKALEDLLTEAGVDL